MSTHTSVCLMSVHPYLLHDNGGVLWSHVSCPCVHLSVSPAIERRFFHLFNFRRITWVNMNGFSPNLVCALILWRSGLGKFHQFLTELSAHDVSLFSFWDKDLSKFQWIFAKLGMCIDIVETCFWIANGQSSSICDRVICPQHDTAGYYSFRFLLYIFFVWIQHF